VEPTGPASASAPDRALLVRLALANLGYAQASYLGLLIILPGQATAIEGRAHRTLLLAAAAAAGAVVALPAGIAAGQFSDRRLRRTGFRRPVLVLAAALGAILLVIVPFTRSVAPFLIAWCGAQIGANGVFVLITAALVDWFAIQQRGRASAFAAAGQVTGALIASGLAFTLGTHLAVIAAISGALLLVASLPAALSRHPVTTRPAVTEASPAPAPRGSASRGHYRDARLAWTVRAVVTFANTLVFTFANYYVSDALHLPDPQRFVGLVAGVVAVFVLAGALTSGWASDRSQRRRRFVITAAIVMSSGELLLAAWQTVPGVVVACALFGYGYGVYLSVDQALTADVLPDASVYGRDIGVMNAAISAPQIVAPALAAALLGAFASYGLLFTAGAFITATGALFVVPIRRVR
jgi:MFS family permease